MTRNATAGRHAFARIGVTIGPAWAAVSTPLENEPDARVHVDVSLADTLGGAVMWGWSKHLVVRDGLLAFRKNGTYDRDERNFRGYTLGVFSGTSYDADQVTWHHETVHAIQAIQGDSLEPPRCAWRRRCQDQKYPDFRFIRFDGLKLSAIPFAGGGSTLLKDYPDRWTEIEATRLAERRKPF